MTDLEKTMRDTITRRVLLTRLGAVGLGAAALPLLAGCEGGTSTTYDPSAGGFFDPANFPNIPGRNIDETVLTYAYILEFIEAELYRLALNLASGRATNAPLDEPAPTGNATGAYSLRIDSGGLPATNARRFSLSRAVCVCRARAP